MSGVGREAQKYWKHWESMTIKAGNLQVQKMASQLMTCTGMDLSARD